MGKRIILTTFGSYGDIHPYMALAAELHARGHQPVIATSELYREKLETAGFDFVPVRPNLPPPAEQDPELIARVMHPMKGSAVLLNEMLFPFLREAYEDLLQAIKGADLLLTHPITFAGPLVARKTGIPWVSSVLAPASFMSAYDPPVPPFWRWMRHVELFGPRFVAGFFKQAKKAYRSRTYNKFRDELGLPDDGNPVFEGQHSPTLILALFSKIFAQPQPDWPSQAKATGFPFYDGNVEQGMPQDLLDFLDAGPPPIVFTLGTSAVWVAKDFYSESIAAAKSLGRRAVLLIGDQRNRLSESLPPEIFPADYAPFEALLPRASAMVHHGGVGTTSQGLRAGIPTLIVPFAFDQPDNAAHAERLGTSRTLRRPKYSAARAARELRQLLEEPSYARNARKVGEQLRAENGSAVACDLIEAVLQSKDSSNQLSEELVYASGD
ncbi:MAG TPA: glycosyltransferase [Pyrinomonadaceae bacterium]|nr:glycosyltransferase [Pyrinomonadaceae bacterium]